MCALNWSEVEKLVRDVSFLIHWCERLLGFHITTKSSISPWKEKKAPHKNGYIFNMKKKKKGGCRVVGGGPSNYNCVKAICWFLNEMEWVVDHDNTHEQQEEKEGSEEKGWNILGGTIVYFEGESFLLSSHLSTRKRVPKIEVHFWFFLYFSIFFQSMEGNIFYQ